MKYNDHRKHILEQTLNFLQDKGLCAVTLYLSVALIFSFLGMFIYARSAEAEDSFQKGICYVAWEQERYLSPHSDIALERLAATGAQWVAIVATYYQEKYNSLQIFPTQHTPSDRSITHAIKQARKLGLNVMLKPHLDLIDKSDGLWRGDIGFQEQSDWQRWFSGYLKFILHYAKLAQRNDVQMLCIGTELSFASAQTQFWEEYVIPRIREVYSGKLIYAANWDEYKNVRFWDKLDYIGIDAYFPLSEKKNPEYKDVRASWVKWADQIQQWQETIDKPIVFTEIGYRSCAFAATRPWDSTSTRQVNLEIQANCYKAALDVLYNRAWCYGIYWWYWKPSPYAGGRGNRDFIPQGKPAETVLTYWYNIAIFADLPKTSTYE